MQYKVTQTVIGPCLWSYTKDDPRRKVRFTHPRDQTLDGTVPVAIEGGMILSDKALVELEWPDFLREEFLTRGVLVTVDDEGNPIAESITDVDLAGTAGARAQAEDETATDIQTGLPTAKGDMTDSGDLEEVADTSTPEYLS